MMLETLEDRIAPATIVVGSVGATGYDDQPFVDAASSLAQAEQAAIYDLFNGSTQHYYLVLQASDKVLFEPADNSVFLAVNSGTAIAFFYDQNNDNIVGVNELTGLALGANASVNVGYSVNGDVLTSVNSTTGLFEKSLIADTQAIRQLTVSGSVVGNIYAGGAISNVQVGSVEMIGTGTVGNGATFDIGGGTGFGTDVLAAITIPAGKAAPGITNVSISGGVDSIIASNGGSNGAGGSISNILVQTDVDGLLIQAGHGGAGAGTLSGGAGGRVTNVTIQGNIDTQLVPTTDLIAIHAGDGGVAAGTGSGGAGGAVSLIYVGYDRAGSSIIKSADFSNDRVEVTGGDGGSGARAGGVGGSLSSINVRVAPGSAIGDGVLIEAGNGGDGLASAGRGGNGGSISNYYVVNNSEFLATLSNNVVEAGAGGNGVGGGGTGGSLVTGVILGQHLSVSAGDGGDSDLRGGVAGSLTNLKIAFRGDAALTQFGQQESNLRNVFAREVFLRAGAGGDALVSGAGGAGGNISNVLAPQTDLRAFEINDTFGGDGGIATAGAGGRGGSLNGLRFDFDIDSADSVVANIRSGDGGNGARTGGAGGAFSNSSFLLSDATINASSGNGGHGLAGGTGGAATLLTFATRGSVGLSLGSVTFAAGNGGNSVTTITPLPAEPNGTGRGGNGGSLSQVSAQAWGNVELSSGQGGGTGSGTAGNGGNIVRATLQAEDPTYQYLTVFTRDFDPNIVNPEDRFTSYFLTQAPTPATGSNATLIAGSAGGAGTGFTPARGGIGGSITSASLESLAEVSVQGGDGSFGGAGGNVTGITASGAAFDVVTIFQTFNVATGVTTTDFSNATNPVIVTGLFGDVSVVAGDGGDGPAVGGRGGSLANVIAYTSYVSSDSAIFEAGDGGNATTGRGGQGGSLTGLSILDGSAEFSAIAGNGGDGGGLAGAGGAGGALSDVSVVPEIMARVIAAGDGGDALSGRSGGVGGSIARVFVSGDIGERWGADYGFGTTSSSMGGIFAGSGGVSALTTARSGNVTDVTALAIASIVAGRDSMPELVGRIDNVILRSFTTLAPNVDGSFDASGGTVDTINNTTTNINDASFVGGIANPFVPDADQFKVNGGPPDGLTAPVTNWDAGWTPLDGLIAAQTIGPKVTANAWLTRDPSGTLVLVSRFNTI